jgi:hypothetical protein
MLKQNKRSKLSLSRETIRFLDDAKLGGAAGGLDTRAQCQINTATKFPICQPTIPQTLCISAKTPTVCGF